MFSSVRSVVLGLFGLFGSSVAPPLVLSFPPPSPASPLVRGPSVLAFEWQGASGCTCSCLRAVVTVFRKRGGAPSAGFPWRFPPSLSPPCCSLFGLGRATELQRSDAESEYFLIQAALPERFPASCSPPSACISIRLLAVLWGCADWNASWCAPTPAPDEGNDVGRCDSAGREAQGFVDAMSLTC